MKAVLITGASTGIGKACALELDKFGFQVFVGVRKPDDGEALKQLASERLTPIIIDVTDDKTILAAYETVASLVGEQGLYGLVNNAGISVSAPIELVPLSEFRNQLEVNVIGQVAVIQAFMPLIRQAQGRIINISSILGRLSLPFTGPYCASKFALESLTDSLRMELQPWGISVIIIEPGSIDTPIWKKSLKMADDIIQKLPKKTFDLFYASAAEKMKSALLNKASKGIAPEQVAKAVIQALTAQKPKTRYLVGQDAYLGAVLVLLPDWLRNWLIMKHMGLT
jgi:NAD(P)-dependent dehydrogenase (short-subunit alcohol dehydrogenase family)